MKAFKQAQQVHSQNLDVDDETDEEELEDETDITWEDDNTEELEEFEMLEHSHNTAFKVHQLTRLSCFAHSLQLVMSKFSQDSSSRKLLGGVYQVVRTVNKSGKATEALLKQSGKN